MNGIIRCKIDESRGMMVLDIDLPCPLSDIVDRYISLTVERCGGIQKKAAALLGISEATLSRRLNRRRVPGHGLAR